MNPEAAGAFAGMLAAFFFIALIVVLGLILLAAFIGILYIVVRQIVRMVRRGD